MASLKDFSTLDISWDLTPEHAVTMYLEWGNNDWHCVPRTTCPTILSWIRGAGSL